MPRFRKNWRPSRAEASHTQLADRVHELRDSLRFQDPNLVTARSGASYLELGPGRGELRILLWGNNCIKLILNSAKKRNSVTILYRGWNVECL